MSERPRIVVVGGGLAGLMATIKIAERGTPVDLFSLVPVRRSHSVCAQGGINAAVNVKGEDDSPEIHFVDTVRGGDFLANQPLCKGMCYAAPALIHLLDRMGVTFSRTPEGNLDFRRFGGTLYHRTAFAGATTGQQMMYALDEQVRRFETEGLVRKFEAHDFLGAVLDGDGICCGITALDLHSMEIKAYPAAAVILATGGLGAIFGRSTNSYLNTGSAASAVYQQGARFANAEFVQVHPTAIPGSDKFRLISESVRGEGGRVWVPRKQGDARDPRSIPESERWYFLEEKYPVYGNLLPRDVAVREIYQVCVEQGMGVGGQMMVYLDLTTIPCEEANRKLGGVLDIYRKYVGEDPCEMPMKVFPAVHYSMGGLWVGYALRPDGMPDPHHPDTHMTNIAGLYAIGEADYQYHGANRLGANSLLSCLYGGSIGGPAALAFAENRSQPSGDLYAEAERSWRERFDQMRALDGEENPYHLHRELGEVMLANVTIVRREAGLRATHDKIQELMERWQRIKVPDSGGWVNQPLAFAHQLWNMLVLAQTITACALARTESRGAHYNPDYPERDDEHWLKTTIAEWTPDGPKLSYEPVDTSLVEPVRRVYH